MIEVVTIDFWNTMFDSSGGAVRNDYRQKALISEISKYGLDVNMALFEKALKASWNHFNTIWREEMRTPEVDETVGFFWNYLELPFDDEAVARLVDCFANSILVYPPQILPGVHEEIEKLSKSYKLAVISDTGFSPGTVLRQLLKENNLLDYFSAFSFSNETGVSKPHPKAFATIIDKLNVPKENAVHIGDIEATDVVGAKQFGMKAIRFDGDPTAFYSKENTKETLADAEVFNWNTMAQTIESL